MKFPIHRAKVIKGDWFAQGHYVRHYTRQLSIGEENYKDDEVKHYLVYNTVSDWNMPRNLNLIEIDFSTIELVEELE